MWTVLVGVEESTFTAEHRYPHPDVACYVVCAWLGHMRIGGRGAMTDFREAMTRAPLQRSRELRPRSRARWDFLPVVFALGEWHTVLLLHRRLRLCRRILMSWELAEGGPNRRE